MSGFFVTFVKPNENSVNYKINNTIGDANIFGQLSLQKKNITATYTETLKHG